MRAPRRAGTTAATTPTTTASTQEHGELAKRRVEAKPEVVERARDEQGEQDPDGSPEQAADHGGDDALVANHLSDLRLVAPTARSRPNSRVRSWIDRKSEFAMPNSEITTLMASSA